MSSQQDPTGDREVFRSTGSVVLWWAWVAAAVVILADLAVQGRDHAAAVMAVLVAAVTGAVYGCALRPRIVADAAGVTVANPLRDHHVPWGAVTKVDAVNAVRVHCTAVPGRSRGKVIYSWAVQSSPRAARREEYRARRATRRLGRSGGYGEYPPQARAALERTAADFAAQQLHERAQRARGAVTPGAAGAPGAHPEVRWAWGPIAAMVLPVLVLIVVALA